MSCRSTCKNFKRFQNQNSNYTTYYFNQLLLWLNKPFVKRGPCICDTNKLPCAHHQLMGMFFALKKFLLRFTKYKHMIHILLLYHCWLHSFSSSWHWRPMDVYCFSNNTQFDYLFNTLIRLAWQKCASLALLSVCEGGHRSLMESPHVQLPHFRSSRFVLQILVCSAPSLHLNSDFKLTISP